MEFCGTLTSANRTQQPGNRKEYVQRLPDPSHITSSTLLPLCGRASGSQHDAGSPDRLPLPQTFSGATCMSQRAKSCRSRFHHLATRNSELKQRVHRARVALACAASRQHSTAQPRAAHAAHCVLGMHAATQELMQLPPLPEDGPRPPATAPLFLQPERMRPIRSFRCRARLSPPQVAQLARVPGHRISVAAKAYMARVATAAGCGESDVYWFVESGRAAAQHSTGGLAVGLTLASAPCMRSWALIGFALQLEALLLQMEGAFACRCRDLAYALCHAGCCAACCAV